MGVSRWREGRVLKSKTNVDGSQCGLDGVVRRTLTQQGACIAGVLAVALACSSMRTYAGPNADEIIARSVEATQRDWDADPRYDCTERDRDGNNSKTYRDYMIEGSPYQLLIAINGKPLSPSDEANEKRKMQDAVAHRKAESPGDRQARIAKHQEQRTRDHEMMEQLTKAFRFRLAGSTRLDGHEVYVLDATPRPGYQPTDARTQVLTGMRGKLWIDTKTFQWVKVEARVIHPVSIDGFLARVEPGTRFELEKTPVDQGVWLPKHFSLRSRAQVLFVFGHSQSDDDTYLGYHPQKQQF